MSGGMGGLILGGGDGLSPCAQSLGRWDFNTVNM